MRNGRQDDPDRAAALLAGDPRRPHSGLPTADLAEYAGLRRRWAALIYEAFLLAALVMIAGFAVLPLVNPGNVAGTHSADQLYLLPPASRAFLLLYYIAVTGAYCLGSWTGGRRTLPMKTWGLALVTRQRGPLDARRAILRFAAGWIGPAAGLAGYLAFGRWGLSLALVNYVWAFVDPDRQFLHDRVAGTRLVRN